MRNWEVEPADAAASQISNSVEGGKDEEPGAQSYRAPQLVAIGKAVDLMQNNYTGQLRDGTGGWYVWGS